MVSNVPQSFIETRDHLDLRWTSHVLENRSKFKSQLKSLGSDIKKIESNRKKWVYLVKCLFVCFVNLSMIWYIKVVSKYTKDKTIYWTNPWPVSITSPSCPVSPCSSSSSLHWPPWPPPSPARTSGSTLRSLTWVGLTTPDTALGISKLHFKIIPVRLPADAPPGAEPQGSHLGSQRRVLQRVRAQHQVANN